jgi:predicted small metal-binding protein
MSRKVMDCRDYPSESKCTLTISGEEEEVLRAATEHAVSVHGHQDTPEFREELRMMLKDEEATKAQAGRWVA